MSIFEDYGLELTKFDVDSVNPHEDDPNYRQLMQAQRMPERWILRVVPLPANANEKDILTSRNVSSM